MAKPDVPSLYFNQSKTWDFCDFPPPAKNSVLHIKTVPVTLFILAKLNLAEISGRFHASSAALSWKLTTNFIHPTCGGCHPMLTRIVVH